jgi:hypothetical protein
MAIGAAFFKVFHEVTPREKLEMILFADGDRGKNLHRTR